LCQESRVLKWLLALIVALVLLSALTPWLRRMRFGRLPGDINIKRNGKDYSIPIASTVLASIVLSAIAWSLA
jgi:hypothetical protein